MSNKIAVKTVIGHPQTQPTSASKAGFNAQTNGLVVHSGLRAGAADGSTDVLSQVKNWCQNMVGGTTPESTTTTSA